MYCIHCGELVPNEAKFCSKCGDPISEVTSGKIKKYPSAASNVTMHRKLWLYIVGVLLVGIYAAMFVPSFMGQRIDSQSGISTMLGTGLFFYLWWKRCARKGWHGALLGSVLGIFAFSVALFIGGLMMR